MKIEQQELYQQLQTLLESHQAKANQLASLETSQLLQKREETAWNALECIEHLNRYGDFYLPECRKRLADHRPISKDLMFKSSWLGEYFAQSMWPKENFKAIKTFKSMNPIDSQVKPKSLEVFIDQLEQWSLFLEEAQRYNWNKVKTGISISSWLHLRLGDTLRVLFYHHERHLRQAFRAANLV